MEIQVKKGLQPWQVFAQVTVRLKKKHKQLQLNRVINY